MAFGFVVSSLVFVMALLCNKKLRRVTDEMQQTLIEEEGDIKLAFPRRVVSRVVCHAAKV